MDNSKPIFTQSQAAKIKGVSRSYVSQAKSGNIVTDKAKEILDLLSVTEASLKEIVKDDRFYEVCEAAIGAPRVPKEVRKFAMKMQQFHLNLTKKT